jgi:hypothetical protein
LLIGREDLGDGEIGGGEIRDDEIEDGKEGIEIADCEEFFFNYVDRCAVSIYFANLVIDKAAIEIASMY